MDLVAAINNLHWDGPLRGRLAVIARNASPTEIEITVGLDDVSETLTIARPPQPHLPRDRDDAMQQILAAAKRIAAAEVVELMRRGPWLELRVPTLADETERANTAERELLFLRAGVAKAVGWEIGKPYRDAKLLAKLGVAIGQRDAALRALEPKTASNETDRAAFARIVAEVEQATGVDRRTILGKSRTASAVRARQAVWWLAREQTSLSYPEIGKLTRRDHTTVIAGVRRALRPDVLEIIKRVVDNCAPTQSEAVA